MKRLLLTFLVFALAPLFSFAETCTNLSGTFFSTETNSEFTVVQTGCQLTDTITASRDDATTPALPLDDSTVSNNEPERYDRISYSARISADGKIFIRSTPAMAALCKTTGIAVHYCAGEAYMQLDSANDLLMTRRDIDNSGQVFRTYPIENLKRVR